jgi:hypothetical protein
VRSDKLRFVPGWFYVVVAGGPVVLVAIVLTIVFSLLARALRRARAELEAEGVELDSGMRWITTRYRNFRAPGIRARAQITGGRGILVLTRKRLYVLKRPQRYGILERDALGRFTVGVDSKGRLQLHSEEPPGAIGTVDYRVRVDDVDGWIGALVAAGARRAS